MGQINKYIVQRLDDKAASNLDTRDGLLVESYSLGNVPFILNKYRLDASFYTPDGIYLETQKDIKTYTVLGVNQSNQATEISVDPVQDCLNRNYLGDVQVEYKVSNNLFSPNLSQDSRATLFVREISLDRTEIRATSTTLSEDELQTYAQGLYRKINEGAYFTGADLEFIDDGIEGWCINVMTEVLDGSLVVAFKLYEPLPDTVGIKSRFCVSEQIGDPVRFDVIREVEVIEDEDLTPKLKGPNFDIEVKGGDPGVVTDYLNYEELFSYPDLNKKSDLYSIYREQGIELSIDHSDYSNFIHFSSAAERLENFRYKLELLKTYEENRKSDINRERYEKLIQGIIDNFDHYERYLYFEKTETAWPKETDEKPYINFDPESPEALDWFKQQLEVARTYDENNPDNLTKTVPQTIRQDNRNEPYIVFVHMIGQHFDEEWLYAKAVSDRFSGDNRLDFGMSKDLVREALRGFGVELETTNQNLEKLFELDVPGQMYNTGSESSVQEFRRITVEIDGHPEVVPVDQTVWDGEYARWLEEHPDGTLDGWYAYWSSSIANQISNGGGALTSQGSIYRSELQPVFIDDYRKETYKRIFHNLPLLLKTKGTSRGLRALICCFGIPEDILQVTVAGSADLDTTEAFFGPAYTTTSSLDRIKVDNLEGKAALRFDLGTGTFISGTTLTETETVLDPETRYQRGTHDVNVGFRINGQLDQQIKEYITSASASFDYDDLIGDPRNTGEDYGVAFSLLRNQILPELRDAQGNLQIRTPSAILRLVRYIDSTLLRSLKAFVPARDNVSVGAIVDDNILHRNRYKGVGSKTNVGTEFEGKWVRSGSAEPNWVSDVTGSIETVYIEGGNAIGVLRGRKVSSVIQPTQSFCIRSTMGPRTEITLSRAYPSVDYETSQSTGGSYVTASIFDDSPKFTGEFKGTIKEVTSGELTADNRFRKGGSSLTLYPYMLDLRFMCLPRQPIDTTVDANGILVGRFGEMQPVGAKNQVISYTQGDAPYQELYSPGTREKSFTFKVLPEQLLFSQSSTIREGFGGWYSITGQERYWEDRGLPGDPNRLDINCKAHKDKLNGGDLDPYGENGAYSFPRLLDIRPELTILPGVSDMSVDQVKELYNWETRKLGSKVFTKGRIFDLVLGGTLNNELNVEDRKDLVLDNDGNVIASNEDISIFAGDSDMIQAGIGLKYLFIKYPDVNETDVDERGIHCVQALDLETGELIPYSTWSQSLIPSSSDDVPEMLSKFVLGIRSAYEIFDMWNVSTSIEAQYLSPDYWKGINGLIISKGRPVVIGAAFGVNLDGNGHVTVLTTIFPAMLREEAVCPYLFTQYGAGGEPVALVPEFWPDLIQEFCVEKRGE